MPKKIIILISIITGSTAGASIPTLWGTNDLASPTVSFFGLIGGTIGILVGAWIIDFFEEEEPK
jgi:hypothetical protein